MEERINELVKELIEEAVQKHLPMIDGLIGNRMKGHGWTPELNVYFSTRVKEVTENAVDNYLRCFGGPQTLAELVQKAVDSKLEAAISGLVQHRLNRMVERVKRPGQHLMPEDKPKPQHWWVFQKEGDFKCSVCGLRIYLGDGEALPMGDEPGDEPCVEEPEEECDEP